MCGEMIALGRPPMLVVAGGVPELGGGTVPGGVSMSRGVHVLRVMLEPGGMPVSGRMCGVR